MYRRFIIVCCLSSLLFGPVHGQTKEEVDSIGRAFMEMLKNSPPPSDSDYRRSFRGHLPRPDTVHYAHIPAYEVNAFPAVFESAFFDGTKMTVQDTIKMAFFTIDVGKIKIESGKVIACDPITMKDYPPFVQTFPKGAFPVRLAIADFLGDSRVAFSRIDFSSKPVARWEFALLRGQEKIPVGSEKIYGFSVDAGMGLYIDSTANAAYTRLSGHDPYMWDRTLGDMQDHDHGSWQYTLSSFGRHNLACFTTGMGDGHYATYIGYDAQGKTCRLLTDYMLVPWWEKH